MCWMLILIEVIAVWNSFVLPFYLAYSLFLELPLFYYMLMVTIDIFEGSSLLYYFTIN